MSEVSYMTLQSAGKSRYEEKKSVFLGFSSPVSTEEDAIAFINRIKKEYPDARHHVYAYALREGNKFRYTDDSEPSGTAGMPTLDAIRKRGLTDCVVVVVRYFGGTLLGTGGLVKAYSAAAKDALSDGTPIRYDLYVTQTIHCEYADYQRLLPLLKPYEQLSCDFGQQVTISLRVPGHLGEEVASLVTNTTSARAEITVSEENLEYSNFYSE